MFSKGFTLVELAVVMTIIGLLIGGVLKGQEMINNAKVTATIEQVNGYMAATQVFIDKYDQMPGDMSTAQTRLSGCTVAQNNCYSGNGNAIVGPETWMFVPGNPSVEGTSIMPPAIEPGMFWKHLALAGLITGISPDGDPMDPTWGATNPISKFEGGFGIVYSDRAVDVGRGHLFLLRRMIKGGLYQGPGLNAISPHFGSILDRKMDDGKPDEGWVMADPVGTGCDPGGEYAVTRQLNCIMYFQIKF